MKFFKGVIEEMKLTTWPTAKENRHDTGVVITQSVLFAVYLGVLDLLFQRLTLIFFQQKIDFECAIIDFNEKTRICGAFFI